MTESSNEPFNAASIYYKPNPSLIEY